jgi:hypothetical protein
VGAVGAADGGPPRAAFDHERRNPALEHAPNASADVVGVGGGADLFFGPDGQAGQARQRSGGNAERGAIRPLIRPVIEVTIGGMNGLLAWLTECALCDQALHHAHHGRIATRTARARCSKAASYFRSIGHLQSRLPRLGRAARARVDCGPRSAGRVGAPATRAGDRTRCTTAARTVVAGRRQDGVITRTGVTASSRLEGWRDAGDAADTDSERRGRGHGSQNHVPGLPEADALGLHPAGQPVMLIETQPRRERKVRADADEHPAPVAVEQVEVVLDRPAPLELQMPAVVFADGHEIARRFAGFEDHDDVIGFCPGEVPIDKLVATLCCRGVDDGDAHWAARAVTQCWYWAAMSQRTALLTGYSSP